MFGEDPGWEEVCLGARRDSGRESLQGLESECLMCVVWSGPRGH